MTFTKEEERILSEDSIFLYDGYMQTTREYIDSGDFPCKSVAILTAFAATVGVCIDEMIEDGKEEEALEIVMRMVLDVLKTVNK